MNKEVIRYAFLSDFVKKSTEEEIIEKLIQLDDKHKGLSNEIQQREDIINKALDFIDETCWYPDCNNYSNMLDFEVKELRKILKGGEDEDKLL